MKTVKHLKKLMKRGVLTKVEYWHKRLSDFLYYKGEKVDRVILLSKSIPVLSQEFKWLIDSKCVCCGSEVNYKKYSGECGRRMLLNSLCFTCSFWDEKANDGRFFNVDGRSYFIAPPSKSGPMRGHAGATFTVVFESGKTVVSKNVWCQGEIPERFISQFKTAEFI